ncbi:type II toxin-antitoxin system VapB family antitoxin [Streptomyces sp. SID3343]|uniref:type II toxin-antitoxin system VapB family antitoxin n=1 Tax=Streptomyces sp. SID3343 TaxID=2690260 RepID=UPI00137166AF|nr:type II toxin-antitoxin system VapB family antitoxin [Streptomyces sp. SID3343]MYW03527.1 type II toxin-antitoxin system VapB family antitoxin [Streptomyces sp. SID3343]
MAKTLIDVDDDALAEATRILGTRTKRDTINTALRAVGDRNRRLDALAGMRKMVADGRLDFSVLGYPDDPSGTNEATTTETAP